MRRPLVSIALIAAAFAALAAQSSADTQALPMTVELTKSLGFRAKPGTDNAIPFVIASDHYLDVGSRLRLTSAVSAAGAPSALWSANAFCAAEFEGKTGYVRCDDTSAMKPVAATSTPAPATGSGVVDWPSKGSNGVRCGSFEACQKFCAKACDVPEDKSRTSCPRIGPGDGILPLANVKLLPAFKHISAMTKDRCEHKACSQTWAPCTTDADCGLRASPDVIAGLTKLDALLDKEYAGYEVDVGSCWRDGVNESKAQCYMIAAKGKDPAKGIWARPGASPHSNGKACDMYLRGKQRTFHATDKNKDNVCDGYGGDAIKSASAKMDEILAKAGAMRLDYEPWHYEWGGPKSCRCQGAECSQKFWPPQCDSDQCP